MTFGPINTITTYLPPEFQVEGEEQFFRQLIAERERLTSSILNIAESGSYELKEQLSKQQWFSTNVAGQPLITRYGYRTTIDLVALNGGPIGPGATILTLTTSTIPPAINGYTIPLPSHGSATAVGGTSIFLNDPQVFFRFNAAANQITITNNFGANLTQCYVDLEYLKQ